MSVYQSRYKFPINFDGSQTDRRGNAPTPVYRPPNGQGVVLDWSSRRKAEPANRMLPIGREWLANLPVNARPESLAAQFPRIVNAFAVEWRNPTACRAYFADLLADHRGNRRGFPEDVQRELLSLRDHYFALDLTLVE
jgi:hypothetical protein